ncbi:hypothetical protein JWS04_30555 [Bradyrhizobium vignae]|uniref:ABC transporter substrate-binding protein n=1 Tax=Bradyrhizobium vignae TaxID=1549949 RepID=A0ABS4A4K2_9BRAD|nr:hypothetical protein [Bradyrhizobium vignae]
MKRRDFIAFVGAALSRALDAHAEQAKLPVIGVLGAGAEKSWAASMSAFRQRLGELGWIDGRTVTIVIRWAEGRSDRYAEIAAEFAQANVDVILTAGSAIPALKQTTSKIPIVFAVAVDPLRVCHDLEEMLRDCRYSQMRWFPSVLGSFVRSSLLLRGWQCWQMGDTSVQRMRLLRLKRLRASLDSKLIS